MVINTPEMWQAVEDAIINGVLSANNACETLLKLAETAAGKGIGPKDVKPLEGFIRERIRAALKPMADEEYIEDAEAHRDRVTMNDLRAFAEFCASNYGAGLLIAEEGSKDLFLSALRKALPGRM